MRIEVPVLIMHGDDDQIVPIADSALLAIKLVRNGTLKVYGGFRTGCAPRIRRSSIRIFLPPFKADQSTKPSLSPSGW
jgi:hypothetical protein